MQESNQTNQANKIENNSSDKATLKSVWDGIVSAASPFRKKAPTSPYQNTYLENENISQIQSLSSIPVSLASSSLPISKSDVSLSDPSLHTEGTNNTPNTTPSLHQEIPFLINGDHGINRGSPTRRVGLGMLSHGFDQQSSPNPLWHTAIPKPAEDYTDSHALDKSTALPSSATASKSSPVSDSDLNAEEDLCAVEFDDQLLDEEEPLQLDELDDGLVDSAPMQSAPMQLAPFSLDFPSREPFQNQSTISTPTKSHNFDFDSFEMDSSKNTQPLIHISTPSATAPVVSSTAPQSHNVQLSEFDPLIPKDWMMSFDSPAPLMKSESTYSLNQKTKGSISIDSTPAGKMQESHGSLLDNFDPATPKSTIIYSQKDMDLLKYQLQEKFDRELQLSSQEISDLTVEKQTLQAENTKIKATLSEWERAVTEMLSEREKEKHDTKTSLEKLQLDLEESRASESLLRKELETVNMKWKQLRIDHTDMAEANESLKTLTKTLQADLQASNTRFDTLKNHAEGKLSHANIEIARVRSNFEKDALALKTKTSRLEASLNTTQKSLEAKSKECDELVKICDALEKQLALDS